jgi:PAS domain S-box-containing protein
MSTDKKNTDHYSNLYDNLSDGILIVDKQGEIRFINKVALQLLGAARENITGRQADEAIVLQKDGELVTKETSPFHQVLRKRTYYTTEQDHQARFTMARNDRTMMPVKMVILPYSVGFIQEGITVLFHDQTADEKVDQAKSEFVSLVSHQLRTPINIISWYVEKLMNQRHGTLSPEQENYLREIYSGNHRAIDLVQSIVNVSRTDLNKIHHKHEAVSLRSTLGRALSEFKQVAKSKSLFIKTDIDKNDFLLKDSDQELVFIAIRNVLSNAVRYTQDGGTVSIILKWIKAQTPLDRNGRLVAKQDGALLTIKDSGIGIPDDEKGDVFTKLFRGSNVQALDVSGVGLGLYICHAFVQELGGEIWYESELREGSTFYLFFPEKP